jgi:DNA-binding transcriptional LysR family regulator
MELRQLRYFVAVADEQNFTRAAERVFLAQQSLSEQIQKLETRLGVTLLERSTRRVTLTEAGTVFLEEARRILALSDSAIRKVQQLGQMGRLEVVFAAPAMHTILPKLLETFAAAYPKVQISQTEICTAHQVEALLSHRADVGFLHALAPHPHLELLELYREPFVVALPKAHPLAAKPELEVQDLNGLPLILAPRSQAPRLFAMTERFFAESKLEFVLAAEAQPQSAQLAMVERGLGAALVTQSVLENTHLNVIGRRIRGFDFMLPLHLATRAGENHKLVQAFVATTRTILESATRASTTVSGRFEQ